MSSNIRAKSTACFVPAPPPPTLPPLWRVAVKKCWYSSEHRWLYFDPRRWNDVQSGSPGHEAHERRGCRSPWDSMWTFLSKCPPSQNSQPDGDSPPRAAVVAPCVTLSCPALCDPQEEDTAPPRPPLPQSYEPIPPTVPPLPSRASIRPSSLCRPEDRKVNSRNGTQSVSSRTCGPLGPPCPQSCHHAIACCDGFCFHFDGHLTSLRLNGRHFSSVLSSLTGFFLPPIFSIIHFLSVLFCCIVSLVATICALNLS